MIICLVIAMAWSAALSFTVFHAPTRERVVAAVQRMTGRPTPGDAGEPPGETQGETKEERLARMEAELLAEAARLAGLEATLREREGALAARETALATREAELELLAASLSAIDADLARLARLCRQLKPREAASLLEGLANDQVLLVLRRITDADAARILAAMPPDRAAELIRLMAPAQPGSSPG
jgi:flagellar motility protein MotE (MotC chaperone)